MTGTPQPAAGSVMADATAPTVAIYRTQILPLSETFVRDQARGLRRWRPVLLGERTIGQLPLDGMDVRALHDGPPTFLQRLTGMAARMLERPVPGMLNLARGFAPRLVHAHFGFDGVEAWPLAHALGVPLLVTLHGSDITTRMEWFAAGGGGQRWRAYPRRLRHLAGIPQVNYVAVSHSIREAAIRAGLPEQRIHVCPIGIDLTRFHPAGPPVAGRPPVILFAGRLVEKKGCRYLIEAFRSVRAQVPDARLLIAGDGPERDMLAGLAADIGGITFNGRYSAAQMQPLLEQARVFCLPSVTAANGDAEGMGLVLLEAQACGVPVVTSARGGATEGIEHGKTGFAFAEGDVAALSAYLIRLLRDDALAARMSEAGPVFVAKHHDLSYWAGMLEKIYDSMTGRTS
ncbi:colanic acid biosynthesis glycosyl transferase [Komagataeibacter nataicola]|uniref:Colanic acid biosynthesis glycosyl transferase n=1 Tax=Komagataeibacter nataicola TaxID=265960 RepID=A0A9N7H1R8_9PROT|nr:glycosyltransferase [Komagataeibacter nataicola]AQU88454.1 colanic acid biosynthesis glycosyl transferase [Komagataeibacter nataicola]PYD67149.1 colanic acid biosynthesis glycosyl transferase [Komagataeibacter nataicola]WNM08819.1 glycosyltransferase [Komagataeibacter nataicola]GBR17352.1 glycosyltransferase [Komagataeibacter nataicola NRIC 0616]